MNGIDFKTFLRSEFELRRAKKPNYSLRAFARFLEIDPSNLCRIFSGRRLISYQAYWRAAHKLGLSKELIAQYERELMEAKRKSLRKAMESNQEVPVIGDTTCLKQH